MSSRVSGLGKTELMLKFKPHKTTDGVGQKTSKEEK